MRNEIKYIVALLSTLFMHVTAWSCEVCEKQQPKVTQGLTHGAGPQSNWDWVIIGVVTAITIATFIYSLKFLIRPGEKDSNHIKVSILNN